MSKSPDQDDIKKEAEDMRSGFESLLMASVNDQGVPEISYAPYIEEGGKFYIFISELAAHTRNLINTGQANVMFIEDEGQASHAFARKRQTFTCEVSRINRDDEFFGLLIKKMQTRFGNLIETLRSLNDFHLFELSPLAGQYVAGFGKTYEIDIATGEFRMLTRDNVRNRND